MEKPSVVYTRVSKAAIKTSHRAYIFFVRGDGPFPAVTRRGPCSVSLAKLAKDIETFHFRTLKAQAGILHERIMSHRTSSTDRDSVPVTARPPAAGRGRAQDLGRRVSGTHI